METIEKAVGNKSYTGSLTTYIVLKCKQCSHELHLERSTAEITRVFLCHYCRALIDF